MIGSDERIALVVMKGGSIKAIFHLGHVNLESREYDRLYSLAEAHGCSVYLTTLEETDTFASLYNEVQKVVT